MPVITKHHVFNVHSIFSKSYLAKYSTTACIKIIIYNEVMQK